MVKKLLECHSPVSIHIYIYVIIYLCHCSATKMKTKYTDSEVRFIHYYSKPMILILKKDIRLNCRSSVTTFSEYTRTYLCDATSNIIHSLQPKL